MERTKCANWRFYSRQNNVKKFVYATADDAYTAILKMRTEDYYLWEKDEMVGVQEGEFCLDHAAKHWFWGHHESNRNGEWLKNISVELIVASDKARLAA